jgi:probable H4MPT-linked C1 transfer pathway protein
MGEHNGLPVPATIGWDLGGAHLKAALVEGGRVRAAVQVPCELWRGIEALDEAAALLPAWTREEARHAVTMTGELCDAFPDRREGVRALADWARSRCRGSTQLYAGPEGFVAARQAETAWRAVASANWHATAALVGRHVAAALVVDIGSTTADLIPVLDGVPAAIGYSDGERLETGELVYTGVVRTPVPALARRVPFGGRWLALMAEPFATAADLHRLLGSLSPEADQQEAADGAGKSRPETEARLARLVGRDRADGQESDWERLAAFLAEMQLRQLHDAAAQVLSRGGALDRAEVIACGTGRFLAQRLAARLGRRCRDLAELVAPDTPPGWVSTCAPAVAVALLADTQD